ncbi:serine protease gd [Drosophila albomicans]|uniref:Serine protease gd n=1 Tax=Drosophila albomicans TaxID=7291 RepID=A0A6P8XPJ7_DROAB|nr:serine protease gd [Drosophila albomicans]
MANGAALQQLLTLTLFGLCLRFAEPQGAPPNPCNSIFTYARRDGRLIGHLNPGSDGVYDVNMRMVFSSRGSESGSVSSMAPYPDKETAFDRIRAGYSAQAFVYFDDYREELPKLIQVQVNGHIICTANKYGPPSSTSTRDLHMAVSGNLAVRPTTATVQRPTTELLPPMPQKQRPKPPVQVQPAPSQFSTGNPFLSKITTRKPVVIVETRKDPTPTETECGVEGFIGLQIGGENVPRGRFPWLAALYHDTNMDPTKIELVYKCVTTLISGRTVITAAHCIYGMTPAQLRVYVGRHDVTLHPERDATLMAVESVRTHPDFVGNLVPDSDVGLLVLTEHVVYNSYVRPICLWTSSTTLGIDESEQTAVAGWGIDSSLKPTRFPTTVNVRPVSREECLREMVTAKDFLTPRTLCAGNSQGHGPCLGDSGGGLMVLRNNRWMVRGIVSLAQRAGNSCDLSRYVIYCDVARHLSWIEQNVVR